MKKLIHLLSVLLLLFSFSGTIFGQFTAGNLVVVRVGDGSSALSSSSAPVFLDEFTQAGNFVRSIPLPTVASGSNRPVSLSGSAVSEGGLTRSPDGKYLVLAGYGAEPGTSSVSSTSSATVDRVLALIDGSGNINSTTRTPSFFSRSNIRSAVTDDGTRFWAAGNSSGSTGAGIIYTMLGDTTGIRIITAPNNTRSVAIYNHQLYATSGTSGYTCVLSIGSGLPIMGGQKVQPLPGFDTLNSNPYAFAIDSTETICYVADARSIASGGGVQKWMLQDTIWVLAATFTTNISTGVYGLAVDWAIPYPKIFASTLSQIVQIIDSGNVNSPAINLEYASDSTAFRGIAFAPIVSQTSVNDRLFPASTCLLANYPNPFNPETVILYRIRESSFVKLAVYNVLGCKIADLVNEYKKSGEYKISFSGKDLPSGIYFCRLKSGSNLQTRKMFLIR